ncbi:MAG: hypothetical protein EZS28_036738 [Streblomastix strix]|uniref:Uncharacterized protein n=1 Tax=Streblomastix strix TaxID=222440 RepID=A0A5J4UBZ5_9EUKA|nr:MAG: hypothetical protein EZS28_036738 [Streblomastix strix]
MNRPFEKFKSEIWSIPDSSALLHYLRNSKQGTCLNSPQYGKLADDIDANFASTEGYKTLEDIYSQDTIQQCDQMNRRKHSKSVIFGMLTALLNFAERSTFIRIQKKQSMQGAQQIDPGYNGVMSHAIYQYRALRLM